ncbi:MAG: HAMP domain-containing sensor histidine kinase [Streptosporangiaceae bacterium]
MTEAGNEAGRRTAPARWLAGRTLRGRLIAGLVTLLALACAAVGLVTYLVLHKALMSQLNTQLAATSSQYGQCLESGVPDEDHGQPSPAGKPPADKPPADSDHDNDNVPEGAAQCGKRTGPATFSAWIEGSAVKNPAVANGPCKLDAADMVAVKALRSSDGPVTVSFSNLGKYQLMASPGHDGTTNITGLPLEPIDSTLRDVGIAEVAVFSAALVLTGLLGTGFVRLSLRPLRRVAATATRVTELPLASGEVRLAERVPDANPRTEVGQVGMAFNRMLGHVESALGRRAASEARLRRFAADASHELRTPLASIRGYAELALRHPGPVPADIEHALQRVESESERMSVLVDELLLLAQLDAGRPLAREPVDLTRLAIDATSDARVAASGHRWLLELPDEPVIVRGDEHRLHQVLANLMSNAAKHTPKDTVVTVALAAGEAPGTVQLTVTDDGPGIPPELQPTLFERFVRGDSSRSRGTGGAASTGLGLAIVDAVTTAHGGRVRLESKPGRTRFIITLPRLDGLTSSRGRVATAPAGSFRPG